MNNKYSKIEIGKVYWYDIERTMDTLHRGTKTVRIINLTPRTYGNPLAVCVSVETGERFTCDISHLQHNPEVLKKKFVTLKRYYKKHNPKMLISWKKIFSDTYEKYVIVGILKDTNIVLAINSEGITNKFDFRFCQLNLTRNRAFDHYWQQEWDKLDFVDMLDFKADTHLLFLCHDKVGEKNIIDAISKGKLSI